VVDKLINPYHDLDSLVKANSNFKSKIIEWAQREGKEIRFEIISIKKGKNHKEFTAQVAVNSETMGTGYGNSKKKAEQDAAFKACTMLGILGDN
jgi:ribonuclease-3